MSVLVECRFTEVLCDNPDNRECAICGAYFDCRYDMCDYASGWKNVKSWELSECRYERVIEHAVYKNLNIFEYDSSSRTINIGALEVDARSVSFLSVKNGHSEHVYINEEETE